MMPHNKFVLSFNPGLLIFAIITVLFLSTGFLSNKAHSQETATAQDYSQETTAAQGAGKLSPEEIEKLVGPIALYPDELIAIVLPASTFPLQIVQAARFLEKQKADQNLKPDENWDSSVLGLLNYPEVLNTMNDDLDWTWKLGETVVNQQQDVMAAIQSFRGKADEVGNLESNDKTVVIKETEVIKIESASPEVIYVPSYNPSTVVVYSSAPYPYAYSAPYPYYYSPAATFWTGMFVGAAISYGVHWYGHGRYGDIDINRNTNITRNSINVNRDSIRQNNRDRASINGNNWRSNRTSNQVGRPGARPGSVSGRNFSNQPGGGSGYRVGDRASTRPGSPGSSNRQSYSGNRQNSLGSGSRQTSLGSGSRQSSYGGGSFGGYQRGSNAARNSQRGMSSRAGMSRGARGGARGGFRRR
jgi:Protein of unknown function (DUF3300)